LHFKITARARLRVSTESDCAALKRRQRFQDDLKAIRFGAESNHVSWNYIMKKITPNATIS